VSQNPQPQSRRKRANEDSDPSSTNMPGMPA